MTHEEKLKIIDKLYECTSIGDFDTCETMLTDDFFITEANDLPMAGTYKGITALRVLYTKVFEFCGVSSLERIETTTGGNYAITLLNIKFHGNLELAQICEMFKFRDGKVCEIKPFYFDSSPVNTAHQVLKAKQSSKK